MQEFLVELYGHQAWADAEHWRAILATPAACADPEVKLWMHHIHLVQQAFQAIARNESLKFTKPEDFETLEALRDDARAYHERMRPFVASLTDEQLACPVVVPWFKDALNGVNLRQALTQAAMHSHYHRAQNATRLRHHGGQPPNTDLITWFTKGQPEPTW